MRVLGVSSAFPKNRYEQGELISEFVRARGAASEEARRVERLQRAVRVRARHLALPVEQYAGLEGFGATNAVFVRVATEIGEAAVRGALDAAGEPADAVSAIFFTTMTGVAIPSIEARLFPRLGLPGSVKRTPIFGLGCVAGAAGAARVHDYLRAFPGELAVLLAVELCSLAVRPDDRSTANAIASGLFGDGAAALVAGGVERAERFPRGGAERRRRPLVLATASRLYPGTEHAMGWDVTDRGFKVILSAEVPDLIRRVLREDVDRFLGAHGLARRDIATWVCHPGGPKVLAAVSDALEVPEGALDLSWRSLEELGNLSSVSVLNVLERTLAGRDPPPGSHGLMLAMGPGFSAELLLLRWPE